MKQITEQEYRRSVGLSQSVLKGFSECPAYVRYLESKQKEYPTDLMIIGSVVESELIGTKYLFVESPFKDFRKEDAREWRDEMRNRGVPIVTESMRERIDEAVAAARSQFRVGRQHTPSLGIWRTHEPTGSMRRCLIDLIDETRRDVTIDLKCLADPSPAGFAKAVTNFRYDIQEAYYTRLYQEETGEPTRRRMEWWVVGNTEPYLTGTYYIPQKYIEAADAQIEFWLKLYAECEASGNWPSYTPQPVEVDIPKYFVPFNA